MRVKALASLRSKLLRPCRKLTTIFKFRLKKPVSIIRHAPPTPKNPKGRVTRLFRGFYSSRRAKKKSDMRRLVQLKSFSERGSDTVLFPSPLTPAYLKRIRKEASDNNFDDVEDSCRSFENYLAEMIVEERKLKDLADVEDLLYCWKNLQCPIFIDLVSRFYGELCKDLFSAEADQSS